MNQKLKAKIKGAVSAELHMIGTAQWPQVSLSHAKDKAAYLALAGGW